MNRISYTFDANADIVGIWEYSVENWGHDQANSYIRGLENACYDLANGAKQGRPLGAEGKAGYLKYRVGSHFVIYRRDDGGISVIRVPHTSMDIERHLG